MIKIGFSGKLGSGKDTAADYFINNHGGKKHSFAKPIYDIMRFAQQTCGFPEEKDRQFLQYVGTEWARSKDNDVWIKTAIRNTPLFGNVYMTDVRYPNELQALKHNGWFTVRIVRTCKDDTRVGTGDSQHTSEIALDNTPSTDYDYVIENNGTLEEFYAKLDEVYAKCYKRTMDTIGWYAYPHYLWNYVIVGYKNVNMENMNRLYTKVST